jgi:hypothetical protein
MHSKEIELPTNRKFGNFFAIVFFLLGIYFLSQGSYVFVYLFFALAVVFFVISIINADLLLPLNKLWMHLGLLLGKIISPFVLGIMFFGLITPISIILFLLGRDELRLRAKKLRSFWRYRSQESLNSSTFKNQF